MYFQKKERKKKRYRCKFDLSKREASGEFLDVVGAHMVLSP